MTMLIDGKAADADDKPLLMDAAGKAYELADVKRYGGGVAWVKCQLMGKRTES